MGDGSHDDDKSKRNAHMQRRQAQGQSFRKLGAEFNVSHSTAHRQLSPKDGGKTMGKLTSGTRDSMPKSDFGLPGAKKYPMPDKSHAANAKARATQQVNKGNLSPSAKTKIDAKANKIIDKSSGKKYDDIKTDRGNFSFKNNRPGQ